MIHKVEITCIGDEIRRFVTWDDYVDDVEVIYREEWVCPECRHENMLEIMAGYGPLMEDICSGCNRSFPFDQILKQE